MIWDEDVSEIWDEDVSEKSEEYSELCQTSKMELFCE